LADNKFFGDWAYACSVENLCEYACPTLNHRAENSHGCIQPRFRGFVSLDCEFDSRADSSNLCFSTEHVMPITCAALADEISRFGFSEAPRSIYEIVVSSDPFEYQTSPIEVA
jgi:hypothetical protein